MICTKWGYSNWIATIRKPRQVPSSCDPAEGYGTLKPPLTSIVLREKSANDNGRNLGEGSNAFENRAKLRAETRWLLNRAAVIICHRGRSLPAIITNIHVIGQWVPSPGDHYSILRTSTTYATIPQRGYRQFPRPSSEPGH